MATALRGTMAPFNMSDSTGSVITDEMSQEGDNSTTVPEYLLQDMVNATADDLLTTQDTARASAAMIQHLSSSSFDARDWSTSTTPIPITSPSEMSGQTVLNDTSTEALATSTEALATSTETLATSTEALATTTDALATSTEALAAQTSAESVATPVSLTSSFVNYTSPSRTESHTSIELLNSTVGDITLTPFSNWTDELTLNSTTTAAYSVTHTNWTSNVTTGSAEDFTNSSLSGWAADLVSTLLPTSLSNFTQSVLTESSTTLSSVLLPGHGPPRSSQPSTSSTDVDSVTVLKTVALALIALVAVTTHGVIIWSVVRQRFLHRPPFYYLLSFCVTELSRALFCLPLVLVSVLQNSVWRYGAAACKLFAFANCFFVYSAALALLAVAIDRHFSIVYIKVYRRRSRGLVNLVVVVVSWTVAFAVSFPPVLGAGSYVFIPAENQCTFHHRFYRANDTLGFMLVFALVVAVAIFLYFRIFSFLRNHRKMRPLDHPPARSNNWTFFGPGANGQAMINWFNGFGGVQNPFPGGPHPLRQARPPFGRLVNLQTVKNEHLTRLFFVVTLVFGAFWFPYVVTSFWRVFGDGDRLEQDFVTSAAWLTYAQVAACPVAYIIARRPLRRLSRTVYQEQDQKEFLLEPRQGK